MEGTTRKKPPNQGGRPLKNDLKFLHGNFTARSLKVSQDVALKKQDLGEVSNGCRKSASEKGGSAVDISRGTNRLTSSDEDVSIFLHLWPKVSTFSRRQTDHDL